MKPKPETLPKVIDELFKQISAAYLEGNAEVLSKRLENLPEEWVKHLIPKMRDLMHGGTHNFTSESFANLKKSPKSFKALLGFMVKNDPAAKRYRAMGWPEYQIRDDILLREAGAVATNAGIYFLDRSIRADLVYFMLFHLADQKKGLTQFVSHYGEYFFEKIYREKSKDAEFQHESIEALVDLFHSDETQDFFTAYGKAPKHMAELMQKSGLVEYLLWEYQVTPGRKPDDAILFFLAAQYKEMQLLDGGNKTKEYIYSENTYFPRMLLNTPACKRLSSILDARIGHDPRREQLVVYKFSAIVPVLAIFYDFDFMEKMLDSKMKLEGGLKTDDILDIVKGYMGDAEPESQQVNPDPYKEEAKKIFKELLLEVMGDKRFPAVFKKTFHPDEEMKGEKTESKNEPMKVDKEAKEKPAFVASAKIPSYDELIMEALERVASRPRTSTISPSASAVAKNNNVKQGSR